MFKEISYRLWSPKIPSSVWNEQVKLLAIFLNQIAVALMAVGVILAIALHPETIRSAAYIYVLVFIASILLHHGAQFVLGKWMRPSEADRKESALVAAPVGEANFK